MLNDIERYRDATNGLLGFIGDFNFLKVKLDEEEIQGGVLVIPLLLNTHISSTYTVLTLETATTYRVMEPGWFDFVSRSRALDPAVYHYIYGCTSPTWAC